MGAGLAGVTTAWYLARDGHEVVVIDREPEVAAAASYANTGIIAASRAYPWAAGEIGRAQRFDPELWIWLAQHLLLRSGRSYRRVLEAKVRLVRYSQQLLHALIRDAGVSCELTRGVLYLYREGETLDEGMAARGRDARPRLRDREARACPAGGVANLRSMPRGSPGRCTRRATSAADAALFCRGLAARLRALGVNFYLENEILSIEPSTCAFAKW